MKAAKKPIGVSAVAADEVRRVEIPENMTEDVFRELRDGYKRKY